ncbi:MAG: hypothetical protein JST61_08660 [Acidobacteria bacterium]|nr:hypothetical protein [Acidobacteriota bacterium]
MYFGETIGLLLVLTAAILTLRFFWHRFPPRIERIVLGAAAIVFAIRLVFAAARLSTMYPHFDAFICWAAVAGYELMLARFSLMRPRWLTSISSIILLLPVFGSTLLFPLTGIFYRGPADIRPIGNNYVVERTPWDVSVSGHSGTDLGIFYRPAMVPFFRHMVQRSSFSDEQCDSKATVVTVDPPRKLVYVHCPAHREGHDAINLTLPLP